MLATTDCVHGKAGILAMAFSDEWFADPRYQIIWLPGKSKMEAVLMARSMPADVALSKGVFITKLGVWGVRVASGDFTKAMAHLKPGAEPRPIVRATRH